MTTPHRIRTHAAAAALAVTALLFSAGAAHSQTYPPYPSRQIHILVSFPVGGTMDLMARLLAVRMTEELGQQVVVENKPGAAGNVGLTALAKAPSDGYTLGIAAVVHTINPVLQGERAVDPVRALTPISKLVKQPIIIAVNTAAPVRTLDELIAYSKKQPVGGLAYATQGVGTPPHLAAVLLGLRSGASLLHVPFASTNQLHHVISGDVPVTFSFVGLVEPLVRDGKLRALAVTTARRSEVFPDVPTVAELGFAGFDVGSWFGMVAPAGTPPEVVTRINQILHKIIAQPDVRSKLVSMGMEPETGTPQQLATQITTDAARWAPIIKAAGIKTE